MCFLELTIKCHHSQHENPSSVAYELQSNFRVSHPKRPLGVSAGPGLLPEDLPRVEESSLHGNGDGVKQIPATFQQLGEGEKGQGHDYRTRVPKKC